MKYSAMKYLSYFALITVQVAVVAVLSVLSYVNSQERVSLKLGVSYIRNDSYVNIDSIGEGGKALLCETDKQFCCDGDHRAGEWYFPNASKVEILGTANLTSESYFYRNRGKKIVRLNRVMNPPERGRFFCEVPDDNNVTQIIYVNIVKIDEIRITPSAPAVGIVGENFTLQCTVYLLQPNSLSEHVTSHLKFKWLQSPSSAFSAYKTVVQVFNPTATGNAYYTQLQSTVQFSPLQASDAGTASCQLGDNETLAASINITVNVPNITVTVEVANNKTPIFGQDGYSLTCEVTGAENLNPSITYQWTMIKDTDYEMQFDIIGNNSNTLFFDSLSYLDAGLYICQVDINSDFLNENISFNSSLSIIIYPAFIDNPASLSVNRGELVNLNCSYPLDQSEVNISWNTPPDINMTPVDESDTNINITKSTLVFTAMDSTYAGDYFCMVYMDGYSVNSAVGILSLDYVTVEFTTTDYMITEGENFYIVIRVIVNGTLPRNVTFNLNFQDGGELELSVDASVSLIRNLQVPFDHLNVTREDDIMLKLNTTDKLVELGSIISMHITIHKNDSQDFVVRITQVGNEVAGENYTLICSISPNLTTTVYEWEYQDEVIDSNTENYNGSNPEVVNQSLNSELLFLPLLESHTGTYTCWASIGNNMNESSHAVKVMAPSISIDIYANETPAEQESYALTCNISGHEQLANPTISYMWTKNDTMLMPDSTNSSTLIFPSLRLSDAANYKCIATVASSYLNSAITANETYTLQLNVPSPVTVGIINASETIIAGSSDLKCIVQFDEAVDVWLNVKIMWHGPGGVTLITTNQEQMINFTVYTSTTTIEAAISGNYSCEAMISSSSQFIIGNKNASGNLEIIVAPLPSPTGFMASALSTSINLTWDQPQGADAVDYYEIRYNFTINECNEDNDHSYRSVLVNVSNSSSRSYNLVDGADTPVEEDSMYYVTLVAVNSKVRSEAVSLMTTTLQAAPVGPPNGTSLIEHNSTSVQVTWGEVNCTQRNSNVTDYHVIYGIRTTGTEDLDVVMSFNVTNQYTLEVNGLYPLTEYVFKVAAIKDNEIGPYSIDSIQTGSPDRVFGFLSGAVLANNSIVTNDMIGSEDKEALLCYTSNFVCCNKVHNEREVSGQWYDPAGERVPNKNDATSKGLSVYRNRYQSVVRLYRVMNKMLPSGIFRCEVEDAGGSLQRIYVGVYPEGEGEPSVISLEYIRAEPDPYLICTSTDGPPTTVSWRRNEETLDFKDTRYQQNQRIINTTAATYQNILSSSSHTNLVGSFTCIVSNARGSANKSISVDGVVIDSDVEFRIGSNATIFCNSDTPTIHISWLSGNEIIVRENSTQSLGLNFTPVNDTIHGKVYTCIVERISETDVVHIERNFTLNTTLPSDILELTISSSGTATAVAGSTYEIMCTVGKQIDGLLYPPNVTWTVEEERDDIIINSSNSLSSLLEFRPLKTSHAGIYACQGTIFIVARIERYTMMEAFNLTVQIPTPRVAVLLPDYIFFAGTTTSVTCRISLSESVDNTVSLRAIWLNGNISMSNDTDRVSVSPLSGANPSFTSTLTISPLSDVDDNAQLTCQASADSSIDFITTSGNGENSTLLYVMQRPPSAPNVMLDEIQTTATSIHVAWSQQSDDFIKGFNVTANYTGPCRDFASIILVNIPSTMREVNIASLQEHSNYTIVITAFNDAEANFSRIENVQTGSSGPNMPPTAVKTTSVNLTSMTVTWDPITCIHRNSLIRNYIVNYTGEPDGYSRSINTSTTETTITLYKLDPSTNYVVEVQAESKNNIRSRPSSSIKVMTSVPKAVEFFLQDRYYSNNEIVSLTKIGEKSDALFCLTNNTKIENSMVGEWYFPNRSKVPLNDLGSNIYITKGPSVVRLNHKNNTAMPTGVYRCDIPNANESIQSIYIGVYSNKGDGSVVVTELKFDEEKQALSCTSTGGPPTTVSWMKDDQPIVVSGTTYWQTQDIINPNTSTYITILHIGLRDQDQVIGNYTCKIQNSRVKLYGTNQYNKLEIQGIRITGHEYDLPHGSLVALNCTTDLAVSMIQWLDVKGRVIKNGTTSLLQLTKVKTEGNDLEYTCRVVGKFGNQSKTVILHVLPEEVPSSRVTGAASAAISVMAVLVLVTVVVIIIVRRKHRGKTMLFSERVKNKRFTTFMIHATPSHGGLDDKISTSAEEKDEETLEMKTFGKSYKGAVMLIPNFAAHVKKMHEDRDKLFEAEYLSISKEPQKSYAVADIAVNRLRNRFGNIFPYDHCRVKLEEIAGTENSDYINASYLDGYQKPRAYVAAQGPLPNTLEDFWRMIWEKRLTTIVMLTQCFEGRKKCECYWPDFISSTFEPGQGISVVLNSVTPFTEYTVRKMTVTQTSKPQLPPLEVTQFHFVAWPDHGVPDNCAVMLNFIRRVRKLHPYSNPCPLLVHCSAGVGRTGTFIVLDTMLERMKVEDTLNVYDYVKQLREQRVLMVQTLGQYIFIHDALNEYILCGQTEIAANDIRKVIDELSTQNDPCSAATGFEHQFQILGQLRYVTEDNCYSNATSEENTEKNRYSNKLPNNFYRVCLKSNATPGSDYINASFIHGYRQMKSYIAAQGPLESTVCDFWRMVWENESKCVVLLTQLRENDKEMCFCYWPTTEGHTQTYGQISVKLLIEERYGYCDLRKFEINEEKAGVEGVKTAFTVTLFHFLEWPEHETPPITSSLIELMGNVNKVQMGAGSRPMIVMCNDGVGRTGTFICIHAQLERLKTEGVFDFFQFIKSARMQRAGLVSDSVQYVLCHEVLADYLESFDTYANFKEVM